jgi:hypothetical protein
MTYRGIVKQGKIELEAGSALPDGMVVRVEPVVDAWEEEWDALVQKVSQNWQTSDSAVEVLSQVRR